MRILFSSKYLLCSIFFILFTKIVPAQILNVEKFQSKFTDSTRFFNEFGLNATITQNQNTLIDLNAKTFHIYQKNDFRFLLINNIRLVVVEDENVISRGYIHFRTTWKTTERLRYEVFFQEQYDGIRNLIRRDVQGADIRLSFVNSEKISLDFAIGLMHEYEKWKNDLYIRNTRFLKSTNSLLFSFKFTDSFQFTTTGYYQFAPTRIKTPRLIADSRLSWKINDSFKIGLSNTFLHDAAPIIPIDKVISETAIDLILFF
jgi:hypothetical protein